MKKIIDNYADIHKPSFICEIGMFRDLLTFHGFDLSYAMCFGISGSMGFAYGPGDKNRFLSPDYALPSYMASPIAPLSFGINNLCRVSNVWSKSSRTSNKDELVGIIKNYINELRPIVVEVEAMQYFDLLGVPSFTVETNGATKFAIGGHVVTVIGYDDENSTLTVVEAFIRTPIVVPMQAFIDCCVKQDCFVAPEGEWAVFYVPPRLMPLDYMIYHGIFQMVNQMLNPYQIGSMYSFGLEGLRKFFDDLLGWPKMMSKEKLKISLLLFYNFERMEPTRGFLRMLYSNFLREAAEVTGKEELKEASKRYAELQILWKDLAEVILFMINASDEQTAVYIEKNQISCKELFNKIYEHESKAVHFLHHVLENWGAKNVNSRSKRV